MSKLNEVEGTVVEPLYEDLVEAYNHAVYIATHVPEHVDIRKLQAKALYAKGYRKIKEFIKEYLGWLDTHTATNPYQAFMAFLEDKGVEL